MPGYEAGYYTLKLDDSGTIDLLPFDIRTKHVDCADKINVNNFSRKIGGNLL